MTSLHHQSDPDELARALDDQRVMTIATWAKVNGFSIWTGQRLLKAGKGPVVTQISDRRIGITVRNNRAWQESRAKTEISPAIE